jgi:RNA polymerase sigma-70 factor, ECF subfamily
VSALEFKRLALPHLDAVYRTARRLTARSAEAEDLVQQTFLEAYRSFHTLRDPGRCKAWLFRIFHHVWYHQRQRSRRPEVPADPTPDLEQEILAGGFSDEVERALRALPEEFRTAFLLVAVEEMSYDEVSVSMECPVGTVRSRVARARALLTAELSASGLGEPRPASLVRRKS